MPYHVMIPVELTRGCPFSLELVSGSRQWEAIRPEFREGDRFLIPATQFHYSRAVKDEIRFVWRDGTLLPPGSSNRPVRPGAIVLILESPHQFEYGPSYMPIAPLQKPASKTRLQNQLPRLLTEAGVAAGDVVLANPIQFQTSLHRLMQPEYQSGIQSAVRDSVWKALYSAQVDGVKPFEEAFLDRIRSYHPALVINACTAGVKGLVDATLRAPGAWRVVGVSHHPSYWSRTTRLLP